MSETEKLQREFWAKWPEASADMEAMLASYEAKCEALRRPLEMALSVGYDDCGWQKAAAKALSETMSDQCKHGWTAPPECPRCIEQERDNLAERLTLLCAQIADLQDLLRYVVYLRLPLGDTVFDHLDFERQKRLHELLGD